MKTAIAYVSAFVFLAVLLPSTSGATEFNAIWEGSSGLYPNEVPDSWCPYWNLQDSAVPEDPVLASGILTLSTDDYTEMMIYRKDDPFIQIPDTLVIETRMRVVSSSSAEPNRTGIHVVFVTAPGIGNFLAFGNSEIFLAVCDGGGAECKGPTASVNTSVFHTYRIEVVGSAITVYVDGSPTLTGTTHAVGVSAPAIYFGDPSLYAAGTSEWEYFKHNAWSDACPAPASSYGSLLFLGVVVCLIAIWGLKRAAGRGDVRLA